MWRPAGHWSWDGNHRRNLKGAEWVAVDPPSCGRSWQGNRPWLCLVSTRKELWVNVTWRVSSSNPVVEMSLERKRTFNAKVRMWYCVPHASSASWGLLLWLLSRGFLSSVLLGGWGPLVPCCPCFGWVEWMEEIQVVPVGIFFLSHYLEQSSVFYKRKGSQWVFFFASSVNFCFVPIFL